MKAKDLIEDGTQNMRFDCNARVEIFIDQDELWAVTYELRNDQGSEDEKVAKAKAIALKLAVDRLSAQDGNGVEITANLSWADVNLNRIDWVALVTPEVEEPEEGDNS